MFNDYTIPGRLLTGRGAVNEIPNITKSKSRNTLIIMSKDFDKKVPLSGEIMHECKKVLSETTVYYKDRGEPDTKMVDNGGLFAGKLSPDLIISIGGGSVIDFAKAVSVLSCHEGSWVDFQLKGKKIENKLPFHIAVPTTAGTGSEATKVAVIGNKTEEIKKSVAHPAMVPDAVILDPILTKNLPKEIAMLTAIDAMSHALESFVSLNARMYTEELSLASMHLINRYLTAMLNGNEKAREGMLLASYFSGITLNSGVGAAHILAQPISAVTGISHSAAITCLLPEVIDINADYSKDKYAQFSGILGFKKESGAARDALLNLYETIKLKHRLTDYCEIEDNTFERIIKSADKSTTHIECNPRPLNKELLFEVLMRIK